MLPGASVRNTRRMISTPLSSSPWIAADKNIAGPGRAPWRTWTGSVTGVWLDSRDTGMSMRRRSPGSMRARDRHLPCARGERGRHVAPIGDGGGELTKVVSGRDAASTYANQGWRSRASPRRRVWGARRCRPRRTACRTRARWTRCRATGRTSCDGTLGCRRSARARAIVRAACSSGDDSSSGGVERGGGGLADPGNCTPIDMASSSEKFALLTDLANEFNGTEQRISAAASPRWSRADEGIGRGDAVAVAGLARRRGERAAAGRVVAGRERVGRDPEPAAGRQGPSRRWRRQGKPFMLTPLVIAMPQADGGRARLARQADRLLRHPRARHRPARVGRSTAIPSGARSGSARPTPTSRPAACTSTHRRSTTRPRARRPTSRSKTSTTPEVAEVRAAASSRPSSTTATPR